MAAIKKVVSKKPLVKKQAGGNSISNTKTAWTKSKEKGMAAVTTVNTKKDGTRQVRVVKTTDGLTAWGGEPKIYYKESKFGPTRKIKK